MRWGPAMFRARVGGVSIVDTALRHSSLVEVDTISSPLFSIIGPISSPFPFSSEPSRPCLLPGPVNPLGGLDHDHIYPHAYPYRTSRSRPEYRLPGSNLPVDEERPAATLRGGTLLHKGFYDLLAVIPTTFPSRFLWGAGADLLRMRQLVRSPRIYSNLVMSVPSSLPCHLSVYHSLAPCHQRRQGVLVKTWYPNLRVLCMFTITAHPAHLNLNLNQPFSACI